MRDVVVYRNSTGERLYDVGAVYIEPSGKHMVLELRVTDDPQQGEDGQDE